MSDDTRQSDAEKTRARPADDELMKAKPGQKPLRPEVMEPRRKKKE